MGGIITLVLWVWSPHLLHAHNTSVDLVDIISKWNFSVNLVSEMILRYLNLIFYFFCPYSFSSLLSPSLLLCVNIITEVLYGLPENLVLLRHCSMVHWYSWIKSDTIFLYFPATKMESSSAYLWVYTPTLFSVIESSSSTRYHRSGDKMLSCGHLPVTVASSVRIWWRMSDRVSQEHLSILLSFRSCGASKYVYRFICGIVKSSLYMEKGS